MSVLKGTESRSAPGVFHVEDARPPHRPGRWLGAVACLVVLGFVVRAFIFSPNIAWDEVRNYLAMPIILRGLLVTVFLSVVSQLAGCVIGGVLAVMRLSTNPVMSSVSWLYIWFFRGTPLLVQIIFWFNLALIFPNIGPWPTVEVDTPIVAALIALSLNEGAYMAEIVRAGLISVDQGQGEAAAAIGLTRSQAIRHIVLPQAMRAIVPPTGNEFIGMLKNSSLVSVVAVRELLTTVESIYSANFLTIELLIVAAFWYLVITAFATIGQFYVERHFSQGDRTRVQTPIQRYLSGMRSTWHRMMGHEHDRSWMVGASDE